MFILAHSFLVRSLSVLWASDEAHYGKEHTVEKSCSPYIGQEAERDSEREEGARDKIYPPRACPQ
jgi:hypothetical protein